MRNFLIVRLTSHLCLGMLLSALLTLSVHAAPIPVEDLFKSAQVASAALSPDGKSIALTKTVNGKRHLMIWDVATSKLREIAGFKDAEIGNYSWISNDRLIYSVSYLYESIRFSAYVEDGLYAVNRDGSNNFGLMPAAIVQSEHNLQERENMQMVCNFQDGKNTILVKETNNHSFDLNAFRLNAENGRKREVDIDVLGAIKDFWADHDCVIRLAKTSTSDLSKEKLWYRDDESHPWRIIATLDKLNPTFRPLAFDADNKTLFIAARKNTDKEAIYKFDFASNAIGDLFFTDPASDVGGGLVFTRESHKLLGIRFNGEKPGVHWIDPQREALQKAVDAVLPGQFNIITGEEHAAGNLIYSLSDTNPGTYYYYEPEKHDLQILFTSRPWLHDEQLSAQIPFHYKARDGLDIPAYLTTPKDKPTRNLPLVVLVHGGPWGRDNWGFNPEVQFLANRGYAVFQPQFRSSLGFGSLLFRKGWKQWGLSMQDDVTDGVQMLIGQGTVDPGKVCIMGASYGGYAAMMGLEKDPALYRCGINMFGVTDIKMQLDLSDWSGDSLDDFRNYDAKELIGDLKKDGAHFDEVSPLRQAAKIKVPVLMAYGDKDKRVPMKEGEKLRDALLKQGNVVEWMTLKDEGHGIHNKPENRTTFYNALDAFLKKYDPVD